MQNQVVLAYLVKNSSELENSSSEWTLNKTIFQKLIQVLRLVNVDVFASRLIR